MYKLLVVDDEEIALKGLSSYVDWESMGFELVKGVYTIAEAKEILTQEAIDVLLTDIQLENESGLDLIEWTHQKFSNLFCVILSGHEDFEYARRALRYGTFDFLTKPVQFDALRKTFGNLKKRLDEVTDQMDISEEYLALKRVSVFNRLISDSNYQADSDLLKEVGIPQADSITLVRLCLLEQVFYRKASKKC